MTENFYKSIIHNYPIGYVHYRVIYDEFDHIEDYEFIEMNKKFEEGIRIEREKLIGNRVNEVLKGRYNWIDFYSDVKENYEDRELDYYFEILDEYYKINIHYPDRDNLIMFFRDATREMKQKEDYELFTENTKTQIWHLKDPYTYGFSNKAHADFLGLEKEDVEFKSIHNLYKPEEARICIEVNERVFKEKVKVVNKEWIINSKGESRLLNVQKNPKFNKNGEIEFISCSAEDITDEYELEKEKDIKENILYSMIDFTEELLTNDDHYKALSNGIEMIGNATQVDRVYYWENHYDQDVNEWFTSQRFEWCLDGVEQQIDNPELQNNPFEEVGDFVGVLAENRAFMTHIREMEDTVTKEILSSQGILSILVLPVFTNSNFQGFIGFDSCRFERNWTDVEISLLNSFVLLYEKAIEKRIMEEHLIQVKENFNNFFNMIDDFLFVFDRKGIIINANDTVLRKLNYSRRDIIGKPASKLHPEENIEKSRHILKKILDGEINSFSETAITRNGIKIPIETHISKGIWDGEDVFFAVSKDITELTMSEEKFSKAFNLSGTSMIISTIEEGEFVEVNDAFLNIIGYERENIIGKIIDYQNIFRSLDGDKDSREEIIREINENKSIYNYEVELLCKENVVKTGLCNIVSVNINNQLYFLTSIVDITESKIMTEELANAKRESDMANKAKSEFLSHISHEIRTPMNAVIGYSNLLTNTLLTEKQEKYISGIKASTAMLMSIINDILDWSQIDDDKVKLEVNRFNMDDIIQNVVEQQKFKNLGNENDSVPIVVEKEDNIPEILYGDYLKLQQILLNLLSNAVKFTEIGEIRIQVNLIKRELDKVKLEFKVMDTGIGIPENLIPDIFEPFKQVDNNNQGGTGLGLAICKKMVDLMNGNIGLESEIGGGSKFFFTLDFYTDWLDESVCGGMKKELWIEENKFITDILTDRQVLVVDDNRINQDVLKEILQDMGIIVTLASSGMEAIEQVKKKDFDIVLMDLRMPQMDGYEATEKIRGIKDSEELPIIAVSASVSPEEVKKSRKSGIYEFVTKPIEKTKLFNAMCKLITGDEILLKENFYIEDEYVKKVDYQIDGIDMEAAFKHLNNNEELFLRLLGRFKNNYENVGEEIKQALSIGDRKLAIRLAHTVKGVSGEVSAREVHSISSQLEMEMMKSSPSVEKLIEELDRELDKIFKSRILLEEIGDEDRVEDLKELQIDEIRPLLKKLGSLLEESDSDGIKYIDKIEKKTRNTFIYGKIKEMKEFGNQYNFQGALNMLNEINNILNKKECL